MPLINVNRYPFHGAGVGLKRMPNRMVMTVKVMLDFATVPDVRSFRISLVSTMVSVT